MANPEASSTSSAISIGSHDTALCIVPPKGVWPSVDRLRSLYDKAYEKWPPHVNLVYPFVRPEDLLEATDRIRSVLQVRQLNDNEIQLSLDTPGVFTQRHGNTLFIHDGDDRHQSQLTRLRRDILRALGHRQANNYQMHMTVAQSEQATSSAHNFLVDKVGSLPPLAWDVSQLYILVRERIQLDGSATSCMKLWGTINLSDISLARPETPLGFYKNPSWSLVSSETEQNAGEKDELRSGLSHYFEEETGLWLPFHVASLDAQETPKTFSVSSYNVLAEFKYPASSARYPLLIRNILSQGALADVLVLQEVTDDFLSALLQDDAIRDAYPFSSHGPPDQKDVEPLPSFLNIVVLSKFAFDWEWVSFCRKHKGSVVVKFKDIGKQGDSGFLATVLATVHLTPGLVDGAVAAKTTDLQRILKYLAKAYPRHPWMLAGDFNIATSSYSIDAALKKKSISSQTVTSLSSFDSLFGDAGLADAWAISRSEIGDASEAAEYDRDGNEELFGGEQGATYNPLVNEVAAQMVGSGLDTRPQRYDRILIRGEGLLEIAGFNQFGFLKGRVGNLPESEETYASDHWGVRCLLDVGSGEAGKSDKTAEEIQNLIVPVHLKKAPASLSDPESLKDCLSSLGVLPSSEDIDRRKASFDLLKRIILDTPPAAMTENPAPASQQPTVIVIPVGSYSLGVWTLTSDIDVLCIGPFSSHTFIALVTRRLRKAAAQGIRILRRVRASTGTMLELEVLDIKMDLQYCPSAAVAERWPEVLRTPATDPVWSLPVQTLSKLKAARDLDYLRRSIPDIATFRLVHRFIKTWAKSRGIYSQRFGFLGGIQISILLARVYKLLARELGINAITLPDLLTTFFDHYASFDFARNLVFDPLFHKHRLQYTRTAREPLAILGYFPPSLNTSHAGSVPSTRAIAEEFKRASALLSSAAEATTWTSFLCGGATGPSQPTTLAEVNTSAAADFLAGYKSYIKIDVHYWGLSPTKGAQFVGWLESRCIMLLVDLHRRAPGMYVRMWPARFVESAAAAAAAVQNHSVSPDSQNLPIGQNEDEETGDTAKGRDYQGAYLIGLAKLDEAMSKDDLKTALGALQTALQRFETQIRGDDKYFDVTNCWMDARVVSRSDLDGAARELRVDAREWGEYTPGEDESDDDEDGDDDEEDQDSDKAGDFDGDVTGGSKKNKKKNKGKKGGAKANAGAPPILEPGRKFRTAADVMSRIRWDPEIDASEFIVGYEDRFVGPMERPLAAWTGEQTDEEFIPQHRILYFKKRGDGGAGGGEIVWERKTRKDVLFGSGV
ncbi:hypothetical protein B0T22DRAFT_147508 [Podospora appendiculata]|uniref:polynucleotide adenylyltransferase n=1 Tax=Podospora appendiculata TaxID=314037 RepID=A0AAE0X980_9PEZI|nr:hypothetical protein B0T22DRAFT_147508 [Podospora appendiculata]